MYRSLNKEFAKVLIKDYEGFIDAIKDMNCDDAYKFLVQKAAQFGLCHYAAEKYKVYIGNTILPLIPSIYITTTPTSIYLYPINAILKTLRDRVDWLKKHMEYFP